MNWVNRDKISKFESTSSRDSISSLSSFSIMASPSSNVTITLLPVSLSLVHIPRSRLSQLIHPVLRQILQPSPTFINVTCNEIELSLFAESHMLADFEPVARRDRQRQRSRSGSASSTTKRVQPQDHLEISYEKWNVLQIDSHSDQLGTSTPMHKSSSYFSLYR